MLLKGYNFLQILFKVFVCRCYCASMNFSCCPDVAIRQLEIRSFKIVP